MGNLMSLKSSIKRKLMSVYQDSCIELHELSYLFFELTNDCNLACKHCGSDCIKDSTQPILPYETVIKVLKEIKLKYNSHKITVILSGGEPLLYPNLFKLGEDIHKLEYPWGMVTNGYGWTEKTIKKAKNSHLSSITISLDGLEEEHNWLRGKKESFERAVNLIKMLNADKFFQVMDVFTVVHKKNLHVLDKVYELLIKLGVTKWRISLIDPIGRAAKNKDLFIGKDNFKILIEKILNYKKEGNIDVNYGCSGYFGKEFENKVRDSYFFCRAGINVSGIMLNGDILACPNIDRRFAQGNVNKDSFLDIWENKYQVFRDRSWMKTDICKNCKEWKYCKGGSLHLWDLDNNKTKLCYLDLLS